MVDHGRHENTSHLVVPYRAAVLSFVLSCDHAIVLSSYGVGMLSCCRVVMLSFCNVIALPCCRAAVLKTKRTLDEIAAEDSTLDQHGVVGDSLEEYRHHLSEVRTPNKVHILVLENNARVEVHLSYIVNIVRYMQRIRLMP